MRPTHTIPIKTQKRGAAMLLGVVVVVASATVAVTGFIISSTSRDLSQSTELRVMRSRGTARVLVRQIQAEFETQHEDLMAGQAPELGSAIVHSERGSGSRWIARVVETAGNSPLHSEAGRLNLNTVPHDVLLELVSMSADTAGKIVSGRPFSSVREAVGAAGESMEAPWIEHVTVLSVEPPLSVGLRIPAGDPRIMVQDAQTPPEEWVRFVEDTGFDPFTLDAPPTSRTTLYTVCEDSQLSPQITGQALDLLTFDSQPTVGRLDINTASIECLAALPGIGASLAGELVDTRDRLSSTELRPLNWPVREGVLSVEQLAEVLPLLTTRSLQWGFTIEAGLASNDDEDPGVVPLEYPVRYAVVLDTTNPATRVIMIRDETNAIAAVPPPLQPQTEEPAQNTLAERSMRPRNQRSNTPSDSQPSPAIASPVRRDRRGGGG